MAEPEAKSAAVAAPRPSVLSLNINSKSALYAAYMPQLRNGGIFIPSTSDIPAPVAGAPVTFFVIVNDAGFAVSGLVIVPVAVPLTGSGVTS